MVVNGKRDNQDRRFRESGTIYAMLKCIDALMRNDEQIIEALVIDDAQVKPLPSPQSPHPSHTVCSLARFTLRPRSGENIRKNIKNQKLRACTAPKNNKNADLRTG